jgi:hypothetical protein
MKRNRFFLLLLLLIVSNFILAQQKETVEVRVDQNFDIRKVAQSYLGNANLWQFILKHNKLESLGDLKQGTVLQIPQKKVLALLGAIDKANVSIQNAVQIGAKVLAPEILAEAETLYKVSLQQKDKLDFDSSIRSAQQAVQTADRAYRQTKEIRDKTIDAIVSFKKGTLQKRFSSSLSWQSAELFENLKENDMARTLALSLARITFHDLSQIKLNENSQAVIQRSRFDALTNKTSSKVKIEKGDAYAQLLNSPKKKFDLDVPGVKTEINSKYFWVEKSTSDTKLANYNGEIKVEVQDSAVVVKKNQGSIIPKDGPPTKPTELLPAPDLISPVDQSQYFNSDVSFSWKGVENAAGYWFQITRDPEFKELVLMQKNIQGTSFRASNLQPGIYYWRVCSVDKLSLPGDYSPSFGFALFSDKTKPFLVVDNVPQVHFTKESELSIKGKTLSSCKVLIGEKEIIPNSNGSFDARHNLKEGKNIVEIRAIDPSGNESLITRTVYLELNSDIGLINSETGEKFNLNRVYTNKENINLPMRTIPFAQIILERRDVKVNRMFYADSTGKFNLSLDAEKESTPFRLLIVSKVGFEKTHEFDLVKNTEVPELIIAPFEKFVATSFLDLKGRVSAGKSLKINEAPIILKPDYTFEEKIALRPGINRIEISVFDEAGNINRIIETVFYDINPPKLESHQIMRFKEKPGIVLIQVKASDETNLTNNAEVEYSSNNQIIKDLLKLNKSTGFYELEIADSPGIKIHSVTLRDYLSNQKKYSLN